MLSWRKYQPEDHPRMSAWFHGHGWEDGGPPPEFLPPTGIVVEDEGTPVAVGFLYLTNSSMGVVEWLVTDPSLGRRGFTALEFLNDRLVEAAQRSGIKAIWHFCRPDKAKIFVRKLGWTVTENATILLRKVG